jgi:hypothetical protein
MNPRMEQQTARVNVDDPTWRDFRILALDADRSIADYLGQLVRDELRRARRRNREGAARAPDRPDGDARVAPVERTKAPVRLAEAELLTALPHAGTPPRTQRSGRGMMEPEREGRDG